MCDLCRAVASQRYVGYGDFIFIPKCRTCGEPMLVYNHHVAELSEGIYRQFKAIISSYFPNMKPRGIGMRSLKDHWHEYLTRLDKGA